MVRANIFIRFFGSFLIGRPWKESNPHYGLRKPASYPLNDRDINIIKIILKTKSAGDNVNQRVVMLYFV